MPTIDLECRDSFAAPMPACQQEALFLGHDGRIYLFFDPPADLGACILRKASLILFKLPCLSPCKTTEGRSGPYTLYPLLGFFNVFGGLFAPPAVDSERRVSFRDIPGRGYTEIDITKIAEDWLGGRLENRGILLAGSPDSPYLYYASSRYPILCMRPVIRMTYRTIEPSQALRAVPCEVAVKSP